MFRRPRGFKPFGQYEAWLTVLVNYFQCGLSAAALDSETQLFVPRSSLGRGCGTRLRYVRNSE